MDNLVPSVPRVAGQEVAEEGGPGVWSALLGAGLGAGMGFIGGGGPAGAVVGGLLGAGYGIGWLDFLGRGVRTGLHTGDLGKAYDAMWDSSKAATETDLLADVGIQPFDMGEGFDAGDVADFIARLGVGMVTDPLTYLNPAALTAKGALRKTNGYNTLMKYHAKTQEITAQAKKLGWSKEQLNRTLGTEINRIADVHNLEMAALEAKKGMPKNTLQRLENPYAMEYRGVSSGPFNPAVGPTDVGWKQIRSIDEQLGNFGLGKTFAERVKNGEQWTLGFGVPWGHEKKVGVEVGKVVDYLSGVGSTLESVIGATAPGRWANNRIRTVREYIFNPIRENAFEELKRQSMNLPWTMLKQIETKHTALFKEIQGMKLSPEEYAGLTQLASWERLAQNEGNPFAKIKAEEARTVFKDPKRAVQVSGLADKIRKIEDDLLVALQTGGADVQDIRAEVLNQHKAFQTRAEQLQEQYLYGRGELAAAKMQVDQAANSLTPHLNDEAAQYAGKVFEYDAAVAKLKMEDDAASRFNTAVENYAQDRPLGMKQGYTPEQLTARRKDISHGIRRMAREWYELTGGDLNDFYLNRMPTDPGELSEWAKLSKISEPSSMPGTPVSARASTEVGAIPSPGVPGRRYNVQKHATGVMTYTDHLSQRHWTNDKGTIDIPETRIPLDKQQKRVEDEWNHKVVNDLDRYAKIYRKKHTDGGVLKIDTDRVREFNPAYNASPENRAKYTVAVHEGSSAIASHVYKQILEDPKTSAGIGFTFGGGGSGKTGAIDKLREIYGVNVVFDGTGANMEGIKRKFAQAQEAGKKIHVAYVHRPVEGATEGMLSRAAKPVKGGRTVPYTVLGHDHYQAQRNFIEMMENADVNLRGGVDFLVFLNEGPRGSPLVEATLEDLMERRYTSIGDVTNVVHDSATKYIERRLADGNPIPEFVQKAARVGEDAGGAGGSGVSRRVPAVGKGGTGTEKIPGVVQVAEPSPTHGSREEVRAGNAAELSGVAAGGGLRERLNAVQKKDVSEGAWFSIEQLRKAKTFREAREALPQGNKKLRDEVLTALKLDTEKGWGVAFRDEFKRGTATGGREIRSPGSLGKEIPELAGESMKMGEVIPAERVARVEAPTQPVIDRRKIARRMFKSLPKEKQEMILDWAEGANPRSTVELTPDQVASQYASAEVVHLKSKPKGPAVAKYEAQLAKINAEVPMLERSESLDHFNHRMEVWQKRKDDLVRPEGYAAWEAWTPKAPEFTGDVNRESFTVFDSYVDDPKKLADIQSQLVPGSEDALIFKQQQLDYERTLDAIAADPEISFAIDRLHRMGGEAPVPKATKVLLKKPERRLVDQIEGVGAVREPWRMTADEWRAEVKNRQGAEFVSTARIMDEHVRSIKNAVNRGEVIPPRVLRSYPDVADFLPPSPQYKGQKGGAPRYKMEDLKGGKVYELNEQNLSRIAMKKSWSGVEYKAYLDAQVNMLDKTKVLAEKSTALQIAKRTAKHFKEEVLDKTPEHLHALLTTDALQDMVRDKSFRQLAGSSSGILRKFMQVGRSLSPVEMNQLAREEARGGMLLAQGGRATKGVVPLGELLAAIRPDDAAFTAWAKRILPDRATPEQVAKKAAQLKAMPATQRIERVKQAYAKLFDERPEVALAASIENASRLIGNAEFNHGLKNLFTRRAPSIPIPEEEAVQAVAHNKQMTQARKSIDDQLSQLGRRMRSKSVEGDLEALAALKAERKQLKRDRRLLKAEPLAKTGLSEPSATGERWVSAEGLGPQFKGQQMKEGVYLQALQYLEMRNSPESFKILTDLMRKPVRLYKEFQLSWPGAWFRDTLGNKLLRIQHEGWSTQTLADSGKLFKVMTSGGSDDALKGITFTFRNWERSGATRTMTGREMWDAAVSNGIFGVDQYSIEVGKQIRGGAGKIRTKLGEVRTFLQDGDRLDMFHARIVRGDAVGEAAARTNLALYDYRSVSPFVDMMRTSGIMPFATWMAKNIPAQFELFIRHPGQFAGLLHAKAAVEQGVPGVSDKDLPSYLDNKFNVVLGKNADGEVYFRTLDSVVPMADLPSLGPQGVGGFLQQALGPVPKLMLEMMSNRDSFSGRQIEKYDGQLSPLMDNMPGLSEVMIPVRAKRALTVMVGRPYSIPNELAGLAQPTGPNQRPKGFWKRNQLVSALIGFGPQLTDPRLNAINRHKEKKAEVNRALAEAAYYRGQGKFTAAEAAQKRAMELQRAGYEESRND